MKFNKQQPPSLDLNNLDENYEFRFDYDTQGNLTRIRKVRRYHNGCAGTISILLVIAGILYMILSS